MIELLSLIASLAAGTLLGAVFFWGLWATVNRLNKARHSASWLIGSLILRLGFALAGFYVLARHGGWQHVLSAVIGFTLIRVLLIHRLRIVDARERAGT